MASLALRDEGLPPSDQRPSGLGDVEDVPHVPFVDLLQLLLAPYSTTQCRQRGPVDRFVDRFHGQREKQIKLRGER